MAIRKRRVVRTTDQLHEPSQVQLPPVVPPRVYGGFNKFVREQGMGRFSGRTRSPISKVPIFIAPSLELPDQLEHLSDNVIRVYGQKPIMLSIRYGKLPEIIEHDFEAKEWGDTTILWSAATRVERSMLDNLMPDKGPDGTAYSLQLAACHEDIGLALVANPLAKLHKLNLQTCLAAREPGHQGGLRLRGVSPVMLRLYDLADRYLELNPGIDPLEIDPLLQDQRNDTDDDFYTDGQ